MRRIAEKCVYLHAEYAFADQLTKRETTMRKIAYAMLLTFGLLLSAVPVRARDAQMAKPAKKEKSDKPKKVKAAKPPKLKQHTVYLCGVCYSELDSTAYVTPIQKLDSVYLDGRANFLADRQMYSTQLLAYLEEYYAIKHAMPTVIFSKKAKRVVKRHARVLRRFRKDTSWRLHELEKDEFLFKPERWAAVTGE